MSSQDELIEKLRQAKLCALPQSAARMIELSKDPQNGPQEYAEPISADMGLTTQVLKFVNSSFFGFRHKITSIPMALSLTSVRTIKNFVLWNGLFAVLHNPKCGPFALKLLFRDALRRATFARQFAKLYPILDADETFTCALLQDMALPILAQLWQRDYEEMIQIVQQNPVRLSVLEQERMGWDHSDAGIILVEHWGFDHQVRKSVAAHTTQNFNRDKNVLHSTQITITDITSLSALLPKIMDRSWFEAKHFLNAYCNYFEQDISLLNELFTKTDNENELLCKMINLGGSEMTLSNHYIYYQNEQKPATIQ